MPPPWQQCAITVAISDVRIEMVENWAEDIQSMFRTLMPQSNSQDSPLLRDWFTDTGFLAGFI